MRKLVSLSLMVLLLSSCGSNSTGVNNGPVSNDTQESTVQEVATPEPTPEIKKVKKMVMVREDYYMGDTLTNFKEYRYDEKGRMIWSCDQGINLKTGEASGCTYPYTYEYNDQNQLIKEDRGRVVITYVYDGDNLVQEYFRSDKVTEDRLDAEYMYNESNQLIQKNILSENSPEIYTYEYNEDGNISLETIEKYPFGKDYGPLFYYNTHLYNDEKQLVKIETTCSDPHFSGQYVEFEYDGDLLVKRTEFGIGTIGTGSERYIVYSYDEIEVEE